MEDSPRGRSREPSPNPPRAQKASRKALPSRAHKAPLDRKVAQKARPHVLPAHLNVHKLGLGPKAQRLRARQARLDQRARLHGLPARRRVPRAALDRRADLKAPLLARKAALDQKALLHDLPARRVLKAGRDRKVQRRVLKAGRDPRVGRVRKAQHRVLPASRARKVALGQKVQPHGLAARPRGLRVGRGLRVDRGLRVGRDPAGKGVLKALALCQAARSRAVPCQRRDLRP